MTKQDSSPRWKKKLIHELMDYWRIFAYLAVFFSVFAWHRRLILEQEHHAIDDYWVPVVEAAVLAKVVLILGLIKFGTRFDGRPLIVPVFYKTLFFGVGIAAFGLLEQTVRGLVHHHGLFYGVQELTGEDWHALLARVLVKLVALFPLVAIRELNRVLGEGFLGRLFFRDANPEVKAD